MARAKLAFSRSSLHSILGLGPDVRILSVDSTNDPFGVYVTVESDRFTAIRYDHVDQESYIVGLHECQR